MVFHHLPSLLFSSLLFSYVCFQNPARTFGPAVISHTWAHNYIYWFVRISLSSFCVSLSFSRSLFSLLAYFFFQGPFTAALLVGVVERYFELFSQGQHAVFRATTERNRNLLRQAAVKARKGTLPFSSPPPLHPSTPPPPSPLPLLLSSSPPSPPLLTSSPPQVVLCPWGSGPQWTSAPSTPQSPTQN